MTAKTDEHMEEKTATLKELVYHNAESAYTVGVFQGAEDSFTAVGHLPAASAGRTFRLGGVWKEHPAYGSQFSFSEYREEMPDTDEGIASFLASGALKGVGKKRAALIVEAFGTDTLRVIDEEPHKLTEISGIGPKKAADICEAFRQHREFAEVSLYFQQFGVSVPAAMRLYKTYGADTINAVRENPYRLIGDVHGMGFRAADSIAMKMGIDKNSVFRLQSGIKYILWYHVNDGSAFIPKTLLLDKAAQLLDVSRDDIEECLPEMVFEGELQIENLEGRPVVFLEAYYVAEQSVCKDLIRLERAELRTLQADVENLLDMTERESGVRLSENQKYAVRESLDHGVFVITGGPGTGKTTIINSIIAILKSGGIETGIAAPTGRAAKRITETTGHEASTIHRMLEYCYSENDDAMRFGKNAENPLPLGAVIVDEASMIDIMLMKGLLQAIPSGARLIVVGDADQLPSVGAGNVLRDMLDSELIYSVRLTEIFRQANESSIIVNAHRINRGEYPEFNSRGGDFFLVQRNDDEHILETLQELCATRLPKYYADCDILKDLQVLTPVRKGVLGSAHLNKMLQAILNPPAPGRSERTFGERTLREGDKVMQTRNNYRMAWRKADGAEEGEGVFNGDVGFIRALDAENGLITVVFDDNRFVEYDFTQTDELELAYAVTVHKSQGSEFPLVLMPVTWFPPVLATRNLLYTAVTRGKRAVILVGMENRMRVMVDNNQIKERFSGLCPRLRAFLPQNGSGGEAFWNLP
ncbi:MAG: ATP-dependent RecD-like DNA helicase [Clostridiales Family XIII bacterium]|jgi:exodeoxyribonuclease V alpha subunit|nr:ATP-dependent RecD-like DNA helicase [Clostridiales Family XIII bacterium]